MARDTAIKWIFAIVLYFIAFAVIVFGVNEFTDTYSLDKNYTSTGGTASLSETAGCLDLRFKGDNKGTSTLGDLRAQTLVNEGYIRDENTCELYEGFSWNNATSYLWGLYTSDASCEGNLDFEYYDNGGVSNFTTSNFGIYLSYGFFSSDVASISDLYNVSTNRNYCESLGFTWGNEDIRTDFEKESFTGAWGFVKDAVSLRINFTTGSTYLNGLLTLLMIWLPLILLVGAIYVAIIGD